MRPKLASVALLLLWAAHALGQAPPAGPEGAAAPAASAGEAPGGWSFSAAAYGYLLPDDEYVQPAFTADRGRLHLEARYNYEGRETASAWVGLNLGGGETVAWELTPMVAAVFGRSDGVAPGYRGSLGWRRLELSSEGEYVFDAGGSENNFFFNWSELTVAPVEWLSLGVVTQRTRVYQTEREIQRGLVARVSWKKLDLAGYVFNPDDDDPTLVVAAVLGF